MAFTSTKTPLGSAGVWPSRILYAERADNVVGLVFADQAGTLYIEQSADGTNWDLSESIAVVGGVGQGFSKPIYGSSIRLRYVNGGVAQGAFRLTARFSSAGDS